MPEFNFEIFRQELNLNTEDFCREAFRENRDTIQIKKEKTAIKNLSRIFNATFRICVKKGFQGMSMRDLSQESGLSMGALYSYFRSKDELLTTLQRVGNSFILRILENCVHNESNPLIKLKTVIKTHLYLSEVVQPWFYFSYMETKNLERKEREIYKQAELYTEKIIFDILEKGAQDQIFKTRDHQLASSIIKAMIQDWYLKRWKYTKRNITVDRYADFVMEFVEAFYLPVTP